MLYKLANQEGGFVPAKYFSIDRVFRNETLDATHLAEFHQVEGVVADRNLTLGDLIGVIAEFFKKLGISQIEFKPAYNPYTEPSMEIFCFHPGLKKWIEVNFRQLTSFIPYDSNTNKKMAFLFHLCRYSGGQFRYVQTRDVTSDGFARRFERDSMGSFIRTTNYDQIWH